MTDVVTALDLNQQYPDLKRLARALKRSQGEFSLFFAECNLPVLREQLSSELIKNIQPKPIKIDLSEFSSDSETIDEAIIRQMNGNAKDAAVFLFGLERLLPTLSSDKLRATVQQLNWRRSNLARLQQPLLIWLPRYALDLLSEQTPDFYDWYSGIYQFSVELEHRDESEQSVFRALWSEGGLHACEHMSSSEKKRWLGTLKELLHEHPAEDKQRAQILYNMGYLLKSMGDYEVALDCYQQSLIIQRNIDDKFGEGTTLNNISQIFQAWGSYDIALDYLKQSRAVRQEIDDKIGERVTLNNISQVFQAQGDYETALDYLKQSLSLIQEEGDKSDEGSILNNMATIVHTLGDSDAALDYFQQSLSIVRRTGNKLGEGTTLNNIALIFQANGDYDAALSYLKESLSIAQEIGNKHVESSSLNNISQIYIVWDDYKTALSYLKRSLVITQEIGIRSGECATTFNLGHMYWRSGDKKNAMECWTNAYTIAKDIGDAKALASLESLAKQLGHDDGLSVWEASIETIPQ